MCLYVFVPIFKRRERRTLRPITLTAVDWKAMKQIILATMLRHMEDRGVIQDCQHSFTKDKFSVTSPVASYHDFISG